MRAAVCPEYGPPEVVRIEEVPAPEAGRGKVRVDVHAASVNFPDVLICANEYQVTVPPPFIPGSEFAGVVESVGEGVEAFAVGDRVFGTLMVGAFAEQAVVGATALSRTPDAISHAQAAAFGVAHRTAYHSLCSVADLQPGEDVIVLGAGGGVGLAAVQLAVALGATVTAVASSAEKLAAAAAMGATHLVNHRDGELRAALKETLPGGADVVIDPVGGALSEPSLRALHYGGRFVVVGFAAGEIPRIPLNLVLLKGCRIMGFEFRSFMTKETAAMLRGEAELLTLLAAGRATPHVGATFPLEEAAAALRYVGDGNAIGKVVLAVRP
ncbi:MAG: NADPH:quinone oxidoreductase family protein [Actinomycetota bacterium]